MIDLVGGADELGGRLADAVRRWQATALRVGATDHARAQDGVRAAYAFAGLAPPRRFVWHDSPMAGLAAAVALVAGEGEESVWRPLVDAVGDERTAVAVHAPHLVCRVRAELVEPLIVRVWQAWAEQVVQEARDVCWDCSFHRPEHETTSILQAAGLGTLTRLRAALAARGDPTEVFAAAETVEVGHIGADTAHQWVDVWQLRELTGRGLPAAAPVVAGLAQVAQAAGSCWPMREVAVLTRRPVLLHHDAAGRLHRDGGPAALWPDGFAVWAWHGTRVARHVIEDPGSITADEVEEELDERVRQVLRERMCRGGGPDAPRC